MKRFSIFCLIDIFTAAAIISAFSKKTDSIWSGIFLIMAGIMVVLARKLPGKVQNDSGKTITAKPESGSCDPVDVKPGEFLKGIDGVKVDGRVFKAVGGSFISVNKNNKIITWSISGSIFNHTKGGYLSEAPDDCWEPLFNS